MDLLTLLVDDPSRVLHRSFLFQGSTKVPIASHQTIFKDSLISLVEEAIPQTIKTKTEPTLTLYGHGSFHHYTYGLCSVLADKRSAAYTYIHIDQHHDMWGDNKNSLTCAKFTRSLLKDTHAQQVVLAGIRTVDSDCVGKNIFYVPYKERYQEKFISILKHTASDVYVSIDLDVLKEKDMQTAWPKGLMPLQDLEETIQIIQSEKRIIGVDILGWDDKKKKRAESLQVYRRLVHMFTGKEQTPWQRRLSDALSRF